MGPPQCSLVLIGSHQGRKAFRDSLKFSQFSLAKSVQISGHWLEHVASCAARRRLILLESAPEQRHGFIRFPGPVSAKALPEIDKRNQELGHFISCSS